MKDIAHLQIEFRALEGKAKPLSAKEELTEAEATELTGYLDQMDAIKGKIDLANRAQSSFSALPAERLEVVLDEADKPFGSLGEYLQAVAIAGMRSGERVAGKATGTIDPRLRSRMDPAFRAAASGMNEAVPAEGGFLVDKDWSSTLIEKAHQTGKLPALCNRIPIGAGSNGLRAPYIKESSRATGSRLGGVQVYRKNEAGAGVHKAPEFGKFELDLEDMIGLCYATNDLVQDASSLGAIVERSFAQEFGFKMDDEIVRGDGVGKCLGFLSAGALTTVTKETGQTADTINVQNINKMWARRWIGPGTYVWLVNQEAMPQLDQLSLPIGTAGVPVFMPAGGISGAQYDTIKGRPVLFIEQASALGDAGDISLVNLGEYILIDKGGIQAAQSLHVLFLTNEMAYRWVYRINGQPSWNAPLTPYKGAAANTVSPFVTLGARA
jgi:HK97 family phage major capsid protein